MFKYACSCKIVQVCMLPKSVSVGHWLGGSLLETRKQWVKGLTVYSTLSHPLIVTPFWQIILSICSTGVLWWEEASKTFMELLAGKISVLQKNSHCWVTNMMLLVSVGHWPKGSLPRTNLVHRRFQCPGTNTCYTLIIIPQGTYWSNMHLHINLF